MPPQMTEHDILVNYDAAELTRQEANKAFNAGDLKGALRGYHATVFTLKSLDVSVYNFVPAQITSHTPIATTSKDTVIPTSDSNEDTEDDEESKPPTLAQKIKNSLGLTYGNMSAVHLRLKNFKRAEECANEALKIDEKNPKAKYRLSQALIGKGELNKGKKMLQELNKISPDPAFQSTLDQLERDEKARAKKTKGSAIPVAALKTAFGGTTQESASNPSQAEKGKNGK